MMLQQILVLTDFSKGSARAVEFAVHSGKILPAEIILLHAANLQGNLYTDYMGVNKEFNQTLFNEVRNKMFQLKNDIGEKDGVEVNTVISEMSLTDAIAEITREKNIGLIIMGTHGTGDFRKKVFGSNTSLVIDKSKAAVLVVPTDYQWKKPVKFLYATNRFEKQDIILDFLFELADLYMADITVAVFTDVENEKALAYLENSRKLGEFEKMMKRKYNEKNLSVVHLSGTDFPKTLREYIDANEIDILVMINYEKGLWARLFHTSMTEYMSHHINIPLLAISGN